MKKVKLAVGSTVQCVVPKGYEYRYTPDRLKSLPIGYVQYIWGHDYMVTFNGRTAYYKRSELRLVQVTPVE